MMSTDTASKTQTEKPRTSSRTNSSQNRSPSYVYGSHEASNIRRQYSATSNNTRSEIQYGNIQNYNYINRRKNNYESPVISESSKSMQNIRNNNCLQSRQSIGRQTSGNSTKYGDMQILSERVVEHEVRIPRKVLTEDVYERVIVVPEKVMSESIVEDIAVVRDTIIEVARPVIHEKIIEVPEIELIDKYIEVPEFILQEKITEVPRIEVQEKLVEIPRIVTQERVVEMPQIDYQEIPYETIIEVPEIHEQVILKHVTVPQYIDKMIPEYVDVHVEKEIYRNVPVPIEATTTINLKLPQIRPIYRKIDIPLYVPRFIEVPIPAEILDESLLQQAEDYVKQIADLASQTAPSLCEIERLGGTLKTIDKEYNKLFENISVEHMISQKWLNGTLSIFNDLKENTAEQVSKTTVFVSDTLDSDTNQLSEGSTDGINLKEENDIQNNLEKKYKK